MKKYEYKCIYIWGGGKKATRVLNQYGQQGWELVCVWSGWHYLKRRLHMDDDYQDFDNSRNYN